MGCLGFDREDAEMIVDAVVKRDIRHLKIEY
jgi:hypothetical protein